MPYQPRRCPQPGYGHNPCWGPPLPGANVSYNNATPNCSSACVDGSAVKRYRTAGPHYTLGTNAAIMEELRARGPVSALMDVYDDFLHYKSGVYARTAPSKLMGTHLVRLLGWGVESNAPFWLCANEWSTSWGERGFFRILRGADNGARFPWQPCGGVPAVE